MEKTSRVESQVAVPGKGPGVWKRILVPVLCAMVVTMISLRYYNHRQLERQLEAQKVRHIAKRGVAAPHKANAYKSPVEDLHGNISGIVQRHNNALRKLHSDNELLGWMQIGDNNDNDNKQGPARKGRKKVRRETRNIRAQKLRAEVNIVGPTQGSSRTSGTTVGPVPQSTQSASILGSFRHFGHQGQLSGGEPVTGFNRESPSRTKHSPSIAKGDGNPFIGRVKQDKKRKQSNVQDGDKSSNFKFGFKQPNKIDNANGIIDKTTGFSFSQGVQKVDRDTNDSQKLVNRKNVNQKSSDAGTSDNKGEVTSTPVIDTTSQGGGTSTTKGTKWQSRDLKALAALSEQSQNPPSNASSIVLQNAPSRSETQPSEIASNRLQRVWDQSLSSRTVQKAPDNPVHVNSPSDQPALNATKSVISVHANESGNPDIALSQIPAKQAIDIPLSQHVATKQSTLRRVLTKGLSTKQPLAGSLQNSSSMMLNQSNTAQQPLGKIPSVSLKQAQGSDTTHTFKSDSLNTVPKQTPGDQPIQPIQPQQQNKVPSKAPPVNIQEIWDKSIKESENTMNMEVKMSQRNYPGESQSIQDIWDNSISQNLQNVIQQEDPLQNPAQNGHTPIPQFDPPSDKKQNVPIKTAVVENPPEVNLRSADLPPVAMRSKVLEFSFKPQPGKKYAVIGVAAIGTDYNYVFSIPLTVLSWQRIGCGCIVLLVGSEKHWVSNPILYYVLKELRRLDPVVLFLDASQENWIFLSQVSRLFASNLFDWRGMETSSLLITSDSDIWPLTKEMYDMPVDKKVISLNSECCGSFPHRGHVYKMVPMCNIVMSVATWRELMGPGPSGSQPTSVGGFIDYVKAEFEDMVPGPVSKGENDAWYLDQHTVSIRLKQWEIRHDNAVLYAPRDTGRDRVDRSNWFPYQINRSNDIHMLEHLYQPGTWERARPVLRQMYNETKNKDLEQYRDGFIRMLLNYKVSN